MEIESVKWWQSDVIRAQIVGLISAAVAAAVAIGSIFGITIDPVFQGKLIAAFMAVFAVVCGGANIWGIVARRAVTTVIEGSKGEQKVVDAGGTVTPKTS